MVNLQTSAALNDQAAAIAEELASASTTLQAAQLCRRSRNAVLREINAGRIRALRVGQKFFVPRVEVERLLVGTQL